MKPKLGTFVTALLAGSFEAAWAQKLGRVHFETSCTPQAQAVNHSSPPFFKSRSFSTFPSVSFVSDCLLL
ncbi:MAG TPA: hypothetical protein VK620_22245 [Bradyrhizobium sp.]|jgi:hypothetical protein|nr:hypothetical protein [Bradyrhizobium sp.]